MKSFPSKEQGHTKILQQGMSGHTRRTHTVGYTDGFYIITTNEQSCYVARTGFCDYALFIQECD